MRKLISEQELFRFDRPLKVKVYENEWTEPDEGEIVVERLVLEVECESLTSPHVTGLCHVYWRNGGRSPSAYFTFKSKPSLSTTLSSVLKEGELAARLEAMLLVTALGHPNRDFEKDYRTVLSLLDDCVVTPSVMEQVRDYYETTGGDSLQWRLSNIPFHCLSEKEQRECFAAHMDEQRGVGSSRDYTRQVPTQEGLLHHPKYTDHAKRDELIRKLKEYHQKLAVNRKRINNHE